MPCVFTFADGGQFIPDTYTTATHSVTAEATEFPVEDGSTISDHVIVKPRELTIDMIVAPWSPEPQLLYPPEGDDRPLLAWNQLSAVASTPGFGRTFSVAVDGQVYSPCVFTGLNRTHVYDDGLSYRISATIKQIIIATAQVVPASQVAADIRHKTGRKDKGTVQPVTASQATQALVLGATANYQAATALGFGDVFQP